MRALCLLISVCISISVFADPPKGRAGKRPKQKPAPTVEVPAGIVDPEFRRDYLKADSFIRQIINEHERQFPGAMSHDYLTYYASLNRLSYIQQGLIYQLMQTPGFLEAFAEREPMTDIKVTVLAGEEIQAKKFDDRAWKSLIKSILSGIEFAEREETRKGGEVTAASIFARLRKIYYRSWNSAMYPESSDRVLGTIVPLIYYGTVMQRNPQADVAEIKELILKLDIGSLDFFQDKASWEPIYKDIDDKIQYDRNKYRQYLSEAMARTYKVLSRQVYGENKKITLLKGDVLTIREVHPDIAMFRGYVGNDCATCFSPGFIFNPMDRYYYVFDSQGKTLGYVGTTFVKVKDKKATLIHTIQGPGFNEGSSQIVLRAFQAAQASFGSELTVLGNDMSINDNVNYMPIKVAMWDAVKGHKELAMKFDDMKYREIIASWDSTMDYDDPRNNPYGRELTFDPKEVAVEVTQTPFDFKMSVTTPEAIEAASKNCELRMSSKSGSRDDDGFYSGFDW